MLKLNPPGEYRRLRALRDLDLTEIASSSECDALVALAASYFNVPIVTISLIDRDTQKIFARHGLAMTTALRNDAICNFVIEAGAPQIIPDAQADLRTAESMFVNSAPHVRFYAGYPIRSADNYVVGTFCLIDTKPRTLSDVDLRDFTQFGSLAEAMISTHARDVALRKSEADLLAQTQRLTRANSALAQAGRIAKIGYWEIDIKTMAVTWSEEVYRIHELDVIEGNSVVRAVNYYADYDQRRVNQAVSDAIVKGIPFDFTADLITAKGNLRHVRSAGERDASGAADPRVIGIFQDVTDVVDVQRQLAHDADTEDHRQPRAA